MCKVMGVLAVVLAVGSGAAGAGLERVEEAALAQLAGVLATRGIQGREELRLVRNDRDASGTSHARVQQTHGGVPVWGGEAIVHLRADGTPAGVTDALVSRVTVDTTPMVTPRGAIELAEGAWGGAGWTAPPAADLWVLRQADGDHLAWRVRLRRLDVTPATALPVVFIDAHDGRELWRYDNLQTATGASLYSGSVTFGTYYRAADKNHYLEDLTRKLGTLDLRGTTSTSYRFADADDVWNAAAQRAAVDAHWGAAKVFDYFLAMHGRKGLDGAGGPGGSTSADGATRLITSRVHYGTRYANAFWDGSVMTYGDGDGIDFGPLVTLDIAGHEMTHGITERTANLVYAGEPGALNESISDVFAALVERRVRGEGPNVWRIGEQAYTPGTPGDALRDLAEPHRCDQPDHYSERVTGSADNGGVHTNSGIANKAFYLVAKGGTHRHGGSMTGIGPAAAGRIWYRALTSYMTSGTTFAGARTATLQAATALYGAGSVQYKAVEKAWTLCGVGTTGSAGVERIVNGGFEGSSSPWTLTGNSYHAVSGSYPHGGTGYLYLGYVNAAVGSAWQQVVLPADATSAQLRFYLNTVSNETATVVHDRLFVELRDGSGVLLKTLATYSNLDKAASGSYALKGPFDLAAYRGKTLRLQFRVASNSSYVTTFRIDDVSLR